VTNLRGASLPGLRPAPEFSPIEEKKKGIKTCDDIEFMRPWTEKIYGIPPEQASAAAPAAVPTPSN
jgi:hypothetical protein